MEEVAAQGRAMVVLDRLALPAGQVAALAMAVGVADAAANGKVLVGVMTRPASPSATFNWVFGLSLAV